MEGLEDEPRTSPAPLPHDQGAGLAEAWARMSSEDLAALLSEYLSAGFQVRDKRVEGPCPQQGGKCKEDPRAAFVYVRPDGSPPFLHCHHRSTCGYQENLFEIVARKHATRGEAKNAILRHAGIETEESGAGFSAVRDEESGRAVVSVTDNVRLMRDSVETILADADIQLYANGKSLVRVIRGPRGTFMDPIPVHSLYELVSQHVEFRKESPQGARSVLPPKQVTDALHTAGQWVFPELEGVTTAPTILASGELLDRKGYDPRARLLYEPDIEYPAMPSAPTWDDARDALAFLSEPFCDFPFVADSDRSAAIALALTIIGRVAIQGPIPLFLVRAATAGTGKNLLADVASIIATGQTATILESATKDEEWRKQITTAVLTGVPFVVLDEAKRLESPALASALTSEWWVDRVLGSNREVRVRRPIFASCGNNTELRGDIARRVVPIEIYSHDERPEERGGFRYGNLRKWTTQNRARLLVAGLTVLRAYVLAGRPDQSLPAYGSFESWSELVRSALVWSGSADPCDGRARIREEADSGLAELKTLLCAWDRVCGSTPHTVPELIAAAARDDGFAEAISPFAVGKSGIMEARKLSYSLRTVKGRVIDKRRVERAGETHDHVSRWLVVSEVAG